MKTTALEKHSHRVVVGVHKIVYLAVKLGNDFGQYFTSENIHRELLSLINPAVYLLNKKCGLNDSRYCARVMAKCDFFP